MPRLARIAATGPVNEADRLFVFWDDMQLLLHAETYHRHHELGLMPRSHWERYEWFVKNRMATPALRETWAGVRDGYSANFAKWMDETIFGGAEIAEPAKTGRADQ